MMLLSGGVVVSAVLFSLLSFCVVVFPVVVFSPWSFWSQRILFCLLRGGVLFVVLIRSSAFCLVCFCRGVVSVFFLRCFCFFCVW